MSRLLATAAAALLLAAGAPADGAAQETHVLVVAGLGGTEEYREEFRTLAEDLHGALVEHHGIPAERITVLGEQPDASPVVSDRSTRANVLKELGELAAAVGPDDQVVVVLIGHGTARGEEAQINLPGPDLGPEDFAAGLSVFPTQRLALVHTGSASGGFLAPLSGPGRVIITATRSSRERNATEFPRFFVEALEGEAADLDKDGRVSLLEAFQYANVETARHYDEEGEILVEHAVLDDDGDGEGSREPGAQGADGTLAASFHFSAGRKDSMTQEDYDEALQSLLVELALKGREIRAREGGG